VVIPVHNGGHDLGRCLRALRDCCRPEDEIVVIDDGSTDGSAALAESFGARLLRHDRPLGPAAARNAGARAARNPIVFFLDADVVPHLDTLSRALDHLAANPDLAALFGSYDDTPDAPGLVSQYRNLLHHYVHQQGRFEGDARPAHTFWTGCGAIRRDVFLDLGGFDPLLYRRPAIEDIEFGYRMSRAGFKVVLARDVQATHLKRWTLMQVVRTDVFRRGVPWMLLMLRMKAAENDLNVEQSQRVCVAATGLGLLGLLAAPWYPVALALLGVNLATIVALNLGFYRFLARRRGRAFAAAALPLHYLYFCCCGLSVAIALALRHLPARRPDRADGTPLAPSSRDRRDAPSPASPPPNRVRRDPRWTRPRA
jgi:hypothetical protein